MQRDLTTLIRTYDASAPGASPEAVTTVERYFGIQFPADYRQFMLKCNGAEGPIGATQYVAVWPIEELVDVNAGYGGGQPIPGMILFAGDGGGEAYAFDVRTSAMPIIMVNYITLNFEEALPAVGSFTDLLNALDADRTFFERGSA